MSVFELLNSVCINLQACRNFDNENLCEHFCPPEYIYSPTLFRQVPNPDVKYAYGSLCVHKCPCKLYLCIWCVFFNLLNFYLHASYANKAVIVSTGICLLSVCMCVCLCKKLKIYLSEIDVTLYKYVPRWTLEVFGLGDIWPWTLTLRDILVSLDGGVSTVIVQKLI